MPSTAGCWRRPPPSWAAAIVAVSLGVDMSIGLVILMLAPAVTVVGYEAMGYRHQADAKAAT